MRHDQAERLAALWHRRTTTGPEDEHGLYDQMVEFLTTVVPDTEFAAVVPRTAPKATHHEALYSHEILALGEEVLFRIGGERNPLPEPGRPEYTLNASTVLLAAFVSVQAIDERLLDGDTAQHRRGWYYRTAGQGHPTIGITIDERFSRDFTGDEERLAVEMARRLGWR